MKINRLLVSGFIFLIFALTPFLAFDTAFAATIRVPTDQPTIQSGIYVASPGDTVLVADGVYTGYGNKNITFGGLAITVRSENGPGNCIIDCEEDGRGFKFFNNEGLDSVLSGFTIRNGLPDGYENEDGGGIYICPGSSPTIENCIIKNNGNTDDGVGGGIMIDGHDPYLGPFPTFPMIKDCVIINNQALHAGGIRSTYANPTILNCRIEGNSGIQGGVSLYTGNALITNCIIRGNSASLNGGGISINGQASPVISGCLISENVAYAEGGGVYSFISNPQFINCVIVNNTCINDPYYGVVGKGGGVYCGFPPSFTNCTFAGNRADIGGDFYLFTTSSPTITNCILWSTTTPIYFGSGNPSITYSCIYGGYFGTGNINSNPQFVGGSNYSLISSSPCIDTGTSSGAPNTDIDGISRPQGSGYDMGAYEFLVKAMPWLLLLLLGG